MSSAIEKFQNLMKAAFQKRFLSKVAGIGLVAKLFYSYKYETEGIDGALQDAFGTGTDDVLYSLQSAAQDSVKIGAVATSSDAAPKMCLLSNYLRDWDPQHIRSK